MIKQAFVLSLMLSGVAYGQSRITPAVGGVSITAPTSGKTENLSVTSGSRTSLSVGNSTSFGSSANLSASDGLTSIARSSLAPSSVAISSDIGKSPNKTGLTTINISNLTAKGGGTVNPGINDGIGTGTTINSTEGQFASGDATIDGMGASVTMNIGSIAPSTTSTGSEASFYATVHPNVDGAACAPSSADACAYTGTNGLTSGNAGASANLSTQTNIDIQANSFTQTFAQSF